MRSAVYSAMSFFFSITREVLQIVPLILPSTVPSLFSVFFNMIKPLLNGTTLSKVSVFGKGEHFLSGPCMLWAMWSVEIMIPANESPPSHSVPVSQITMAHWPYLFIFFLSFVSRKCIWVPTWTDFILNEGKGIKLICCHATGAT